MNTLHGIAFKLNYLESSVSRSILAELSDDFNKIYSEIEFKFNHQSALPHFFLDFMYSLIKYQRWLDVDPFKQILNSYLHTDYGIDPTYLVEKNAIFMPLCKEKIITPKNYYLKPNDLNFLMHLFLQMLHCPPAVSVSHYVGLGREILHKFNQISNQLTDKHPKQHTTVAFLPVLDFLIESLLEEIYNTKHKLPWFLDIQKLKLQLYNVPPEIEATIQQTGFSWILEALYNIGIYQLTVKDTKAKEDNSTKITAPILAFLQEQEFVTCTADKKSLSQLTQFGEEITACYFIQHRTKDDNYENFAKLPISWQKSLLTELCSNAHASVLTWLENAIPLHPQCLEIVVEKLSKEGYHANILGYLKKQHRNGITYGIRENALYHLRKLDSSYDRSPTQTPA